jgi:serine/threonine protein kinase
MGRYEITGPLGVGGYGDVFRAKDTAMNRDVAIKYLRHLSPENFFSLQREARNLWREQDNPYILKLLDYDFNTTHRPWHSVAAKFTSSTTLGGLYTIEAIQR